MDFKHCVVFVSTSKKDEALRIQESLVKDQLAACVQLIDNVTSSFTWRFKIEKSVECLLVIKTRTELFEKLMKRVKELHSAEVPEIVAIPIISGNPSYLSWIDETTTP